jgi:hypothetical protein
MVAHQSPTLQTPFLLRVKVSEHEAANWESHFGFTYEQIECLLDCQSNIERGVSTVERNQLLIIRLRY